MNAAAASAAKIWRGYACAGLRRGYRTRPVAAGTCGDPTFTFFKIFVLFVLKIAFQRLHALRAMRCEVAAIGAAVAWRHRNQSCCRGRKQILRICCREREGLSSAERLGHAAGEGPSHDVAARLEKKWRGGELDLGRCGVV